MTVESNRPRAPQSDTQVAWAACRPKRSGEGWSRPCAVARVRAQCLAGVRQWQTDNGYWVSSVLADAQEHPWRLEIARSYEADFNAATAAEIDALAARFLTEKNLFQFTIKPEYHRP